MSSGPQYSGAIVVLQVRTSIDEMAAAFPGVDRRSATSGGYGECHGVIGAESDPGAQNQIRVILEGLAARAVRYGQEQGLGIYKRAKLGNVFRWKLKELGYSAAFTERATKELVTRLAVRHSSRRMSRDMMSPLCK